MKAVRFLPVDETVSVFLGTSATGPAAVVENGDHGIEGTRKGKISVALICPSLDDEREILEPRGLLTSFPKKTPVS